MALRLFQWEGGDEEETEKSGDVSPSVPTSSDEAQRILDVVAEILGDRGYDALQVRDVAGALECR